MITETPYKRSFIDILNDVVTAMPTPVVTIYKVLETSAFNWTLYVNDFVYAACDYQITIQGNKYTIILLDDTRGNFKINITDTTGSLSAPMPGDFTLYPFFFFHGTPIDTSNEIKAVQAEDKYPMIWLKDDFTEKNSWDPSTANDRETTCSIYFLDQANIKSGPTDLRWDNYIKSMMKFRDYFMNYLLNTLQDFLPWGQETNDKYYSRFGVYLLGNGVTEALFADNLVGVEMNGTFTIRSLPEDFKNCGL